MLPSSDSDIVTYDYYCLFGSKIIWINKMKKIGSSKFTGMWYIYKH